MVGSYSAGVLPSSDLPVEKEVATLRLDELLKRINVRANALITQISAAFALNLGVLEL
jgi:hypothetical protein